MSIFANLLISTISILVADYFLPFVHLDGFFTAFVVALILAIVNIFVKPIITLLTLPITLLSLGLFLLIINTFMIMLVDWMIPGFRIDGFLETLVFGLIVSIVSSSLNFVLINKH